MKSCIHCGKYVSDRYRFHECQVWGKRLDSLTDLKDFNEVATTLPPVVGSAPEPVATVEEVQLPDAAPPVEFTPPPAFAPAPVPAFVAPPPAESPVLAPTRPLVKAPSEVLSAPPKDLSRDLAEGPRFRSHVKKPSPTLAAAPPPPNE